MSDLIHHYSGIIFPSRIEAQWAAFFDLIGWWWQYRPTEVHADTDATDPDFVVEFSCDHSECSGFHRVYFWALPLVKGWGTGILNDGPGSARLSILHGGGGGDYSLGDWSPADISQIWERAGQFVK